MIVISAGLQKSGSGLFFNFTNDLMMAAGCQDIRELKAKNQLESILKHHNCNIGALNEENFKELIQLHLEGNSFVVKTHSAPSKYIDRLASDGIVKVTCIYRDPRDVVLSAMDHGQKIRENNEGHTFASCHYLTDTVPQVKSWLDNIIKWLDFDGVYFAKYENLVQNHVAELEKLCSFLNISAEIIDLRAMSREYSTEGLSDFKKDYLHFNVGHPQRFRSVLSEEEISYCNQYFSDYLIKLEYPF